MDISKLIENITPEMIVENIFIAIGIMIFAWWLLKNSLGRKALLTSIPRRNRLNPVLALLPLLVWYSLISAAFYIKNKTTSDLAQSQQVLWDNVILCATSVLAAIFLLALVKFTFARGLKGFGLHTTNIFKDFAIGLTTLLGAWPMLMLMFFMVIIAGSLIKGDDYKMAQHQELEFLTNNPQISVRLIIAFTTIIIVPFFEEILFRGIFQSTVRAYVKRPWLSIFLSAAIFATVHVNIEHWPVIFVLGLSLGYSYEKTGRLYPSIFMHALFNASSVIATLIQS